MIIIEAHDSQLDNIAQGTLAGTIGRKNGTFASVIIARITSLPLEGSRLGLQPYVQDDRCVFASDVLEITA